MRPLLVVSVLALGLLMVAPFAAAPPPGGGGSPPADPAIAYLKTGPNQQIMVMNADGSNKAAVYTSATLDILAQPSFSPSGASIAFNDRGPTTWNLYVIDIVVVNGVPQGQNLRMLASDTACGGASCLYPQWSPAGDVILAAAGQGQGAPASLWLIPATGGSPTSIYTAPSGHGVDWPSWSPDASRIAFVQRSGMVRDLRVRDQATGVVTTVYSWSGSGELNVPRWTDWARTASVIAFSLRVSPSDQIYTLDVSQPSPTPVFVVNGLAPTWSPDDTKLAYRSPSTDKILTYTFSTGKVATLATPGIFPDWQR